MDKLLGLVLCGGESRRMGSDKGLLLKDGIPWALHMGQKLSPWKIPVFYSINKGQQAVYKTILPSRHLVIDTLDISGPLNGLLSLHQRLPKMDILLLACDMLDMDAPTIRQLIDNYQQFPGYEFYAYREPTTELPLAQPFCCVYTAQGLSSFLRNLPAANDDSPGLQPLLRQGKTLWLSLINPLAFRNYNYI